MSSPAALQREAGSTREIPDSGLQSMGTSISIKNKGSCTACEEWRGILLPQYIGYHRETGSYCWYALASHTSDQS
jgi:hypothetical protein